MTMCNKVIVDAVFSDIGLDAFLDDLKRNQGEKVSNEIKALVSNSIEMTGISVNRLDRMMEKKSSERSTDWAAELPGPCTVPWNVWGSIRMK